MQKRGQLYIVAAIIIASLLIGLGAIYNYASSQKEDLSVIDLSKEIDFETSRVIDRGIFRGENATAQVENITEYYANINPKNELTIIYGNSTDIIAYHYKLDDAGNVCIQTGACSGLSFFKKIRTSPSLIKNLNTIQVILGDSTYEFNLKAGQNFYLVLIKSDQQGKIVVAPEQKQ